MGNRLAIVLAAEQAQDALPMMWEHGVDAHPAAVRTLVGARDAVPQLWRRSPVDTEVALAPELDGGLTHVHADLLQPTGAQAPDGVRGARDGGDGN